MTVYALGFEYARMVYENELSDPYGENGQAREAEFPVERDTFRAWPEAKLGFPPEEELGSKKDEPGQRRPGSTLRTKPGFQQNEQEVPE